MWHDDNDCGPLPPAFPARPPHYVMPGSHLLDPFYAHWQNPNWPYPRFPLPFETPTRQYGTGLIRSDPCVTPPPFPRPGPPGHHHHHRHMPRVNPLARRG